MALNELDEHGAVIVVDYKMRILPATAQETKSEFFGKRRWILYTTLIFQKKDNEKRMFKYMITGLVIQSRMLGSLHHALKLYLIL